MRRESASISPCSAIMLRVRLATWPIAFSYSTIAFSTSSRKATSDIVCALVLSAPVVFLGAKFQRARLYVPVFAADISLQSGTSADVDGLVPLDDRLKGLIADRADNSLERCHDHPFFSWPNY